MPGLPSFKDFLQGLKDDVKGTIMYVAFIVISILFGILQSASKKTTDRLERQIKDCGENSINNAYTAKVENDQLRGQIVELMGNFKELKGEINTLKKLGIIKE
jgi:energy-converting hydrogenase Eha subunit B